MSQPEQRIYEVTWMERPQFGERRPVVIDGVEIKSEVVATTASKARYRQWSEARSYYGEDIEFGDFRVLSLARRPPVQHAEGWRERMDHCNAVAKGIASYGRRFFHHEGRVSHFVADKRNELWWADKYTQKHILVRLNDRWPGFSDGGTLRALVQAMAFYIEDGSYFARHFGPFPEWCCGGDPWGYGLDEMVKLRADVARVMESPCVAV